jgi:hypothetical protein
MVVAFGNAGAVGVLLGRMAGMVLVPEGKARFFFFSVQRPQSLFFFPVGFCLLCFTVSVTLLLCFFFQVVVLRGR